MPSKLRDIAGVRKIPLSDLLSARGLVAHKEGQSTMWRGNAQAINVTGSLWFDHKSGKGGVGPIDLIMHLEGQSFAEAVLWLSEAGYGRLDTPSTILPAPERTPLTKLMDEYAKRDDTRWPSAFSFLTKRRGLPAGAINDLHKTGRIFANDRGGVVFLHHDEFGQLAGASIKSANPYSHFSQCVGNKTGAWFHVGQTPSEASIIAITESPVDAISYHTLHPQRELCVISVSGQYIPDELLRLCDNKRIILAIDNSAFERSEQAAAITRRILATTLAKYPHAEIHTPTAKDWNDDLRILHKSHRKTL